jgi:hypothetical protein
MFRTYMRATSHRFQTYESRLETKRQEIRQRQEAIRKLLFEINHKGPRPSAANLLGLHNLLSKELQALKENLALIEQSPEHFNYAKIARKHVDDLTEYIDKMKTVAESWQEFTSELTRNYEDLQ